MARRADDGRHFSVTVCGRARAVIVCDLAGTGPSFHVAVFALHRHGTTRRELRGRYRGA